jgi:hypothetical protein
MALDQIYSDLRFQKLAPKWLPFCPEASFFLPLSPPLSKIIQDLREDLVHHVGAGSAASSLPVEQLSIALNPLGWVSEDAIRERVRDAESSASSPDEDASSTHI